MVGEYRAESVEPDVRANPDHTVRVAAVRLS
jgi:hypothetical protein